MQRGDVVGVEDANIKLDSVLTDLMGKSGRAMIEALIAGETNPVKLASLASRRVKASPEELREALRGLVTKHHRFLLRLHLPLWAGSTRKWRQTLDPFAPQSSR